MTKVDNYSCTKNLFENDFIIFVLDDLLIVEHSGSKIVKFKRELS